MTWSKVKWFWCKIAIQFNSTSLVVEQSDYATKIPNAYIVFDLDDWSKMMMEQVRGVLVMTLLGIL